MFIQCPDLSKNKFVSMYVNFGTETIRMTFKWNSFCECCFMSMFDSNGNAVNTGNALVNRTVILTDRRKIPTMLFVHKDGLMVEPNVQTIKDFILYYEDTSEQ